MSKENVIIIQADTDPAKKSVKDLRNELKALKDEMTNLDEGSDAFLEVANKAGEVKHQIDEINESIKGASSDFGDLIGNVSNVAAGITGAFQAVAGGLQAMGIESKALDETIARMQGLMAVTQGLGSIDNAIKSLNKLQKSITSTTGAARLLKAALTPKVFLGVVAAVSALSLAFGKLAGNAKAAADRERERAEAYKQMKLEEEKRKQEEYNKALQRELTIKEKIISAKYGNDDVAKVTEIIKLYKNEVASLEAQLKNKYRDDESLAIKGQMRELEKELDSLTEGSQEYMSVLIELTNAEAELKKIKPYTEEEVKELETRIAEYEQKIKDAEFDLKEAQALKVINDAKAAEAAAKTNQEKLKAYNDEEATIQYLIKLYSELEAANPVGLAKEKLSLETRRLANIKSFYGETSEQYREQLNIVRNLEAEYTKLTEKKEETLTKEQVQLALENDKLKEMAKGWLYNEETAIETFDRISNELKLALDRDLISQKDYDKAIKNLAKERSRYIAQQTVDTFTAASGLITTVLDGIADNQDQTNKEGFEKSKRLQIASATIQMLTGIATALSGAFTTKSGPWDIALATIQAATIASSGAAQIAKIKSTKFDGGGSSANISSSSVANTIMPPIQYSQAVQGATTEGVIKNTKVYVTETDITNTINKVTVQENENRF